MQERQEPQLDNTASSSTPSSTPAAAAASAAVVARKRRRWLHWLAMCFALLLIALCGILGAAWWWSGQSDSLGRTLARIASWMPADQKLEADGVEGSLRTGGRIDWLRWTSPAMQVEIKGADIEWRLQPLLSRELRFGRVNMDELRIRSTPQPKEDTPTTPLQSLQLPMRLDVPVRIERVVWEGPPEVVVTELYGHYRYTGSHHDLEVTSLRYAGGFYESALKLQAAAPMALEAKVQGSIQAPLPNQPQKMLDIVALATAKGTLATDAASLQVTAQAHTPSASKDGTQVDESLSADITATIRPWLAQPIEQAHAQLHHVDAALFLPAGPRTDLHGTVDAGPDGQGWKLQADLVNHMPAPWDKQGLPVRSIQADASFDGIATWLLHSARVNLGDKGDAHLKAQGSFNTSTQAIEGQAQLHAVNPSQLYSTLDAAPLSGRLDAKTDAQQTVQFAMDLQAAPTRGSRKSDALRIDAARAKGTWNAPQLRVEDVYVHALQAKLQTDQLQVNTDTQHLQGQLQAQLPGAQAVLDINGGPQTGNGKLDLQVPSAQALAQWLRRLPLATDPLAGAQLQGSADAQLTWRGGWAALQQRLQNPAAPVQASGLQVQGSLSVPQLSYRPKGGAATELQQVQMTWSGSPENLRTQLDAQARMDGHNLGLQLDATAGLLVTRQAAATDWQARIAQLNATWSQSPQAQSAWKVALATPITVNQHTTGNPVRTQRIQASAGRLDVTAPHHPQSAYLEWEPVSLRQLSSGNWGVQTEGKLHNLPLAWVDAFSPNPQKPLLATSGIGGDLVVQGYWDIDNTGREMRADVLLERASGDIRLLVEDSDVTPVTTVRSSGASEVNTQTQQVRSRATTASRGMRARLKDLRVQMQAQGNDLRAQVVWDSERAGQLHADLRSQVRPGPTGFTWPEQAPLSGNVKANMPNIGIWALFAPPGWRVTGTLNADVDIAGTRSAPQWNGQLSADQLSVLSMLDGVDLKNGRLRARLQGTRLDITELYLQGGEGSDARILGQSGNLTAAPKDGGTLTGQGFIAFDPHAPEGSSGITMDIQAVAQRLQVLVRADRQLSVSGNLQAGMNQGQVSLRGDLTIDRAAILLADESAPSLDSDVYVTSAASRQAAQDKADKQAAKSEGAIQAANPPDILVKLNLGNDFALQGYGITTRLEGELQIANGPRITGEIHTVNGRYRAWGQSLDVESGTIRFSGPYANPAIDIIAIRPNIEVRAGAKVTGSANNPRVALFSEPDMSDAEKLSWIVMGRSAAAGGAETALLQQAALALLSGGGGTGNFAGQLGLDEIGLKGPSEDGEQGAALTIGKRLSKDFYVAYEQSLNGAMGTLYIFYDLSRRLTLRGQTGEQTAVDLIYTKSKD